MERLSIDEIIAHCERETNREEEFQGKEYYETRPMNTNHIKRYWEHRQVAEYLKELKAYRDAEEQGLLLRLPCKVETKVYMVEKECNADSSACYGNCEMCADYVISEVEFELDMVDKVGEFYFLTKEEAEQALANMKGE